MGVDKFLRRDDVSYARSRLSAPWADKNTSASKLRDRLHKSVLQLRPPNFDSDDATCNFSFGHPTSTLPVQLQLGQDDFNFADATSTLYSQSQYRVRASILTVIHRYSILSSRVMAYCPFG